MDILPGFKLCRKKLHQYPVEKRQCPECRKTAKQKWYQNNIEFCAQLRKNWNKKNREQRNKLTQKWKKINKDKINAINSKRRAIKKQAIPLWVNEKAIKKVYKKAVELTKATGIPHEVDHIFPLKSKYMCGLHVENNLQILTKKENLAKGNHSWPGQLDCQRE
jgi:5-methylcytosine-specific restriction endonuclease McrA